MRQRYGQPGPGSQTNGTLERIQEALAALESRAGLVPAPPRAAKRSAIDDVSAIRSRQTALDGRHERTRVLSGELDRLRDDLGREQRLSQGGFEALRDEIRALRAPDEDLRTLRRDMADLRTSAAGTGSLHQEVEQLKSQILDLAREDTLRELTDRWSVIEREIAGLPETLASRKDMQGLAERLDGLNQSVRQTPQSPTIDRLEGEIRTLATAVEKMARQGGASDQALHADLDARLDEISRAISASAGAGRNASDTDTIDRIEARMAALANQIDSIAATAAPSNWTDLEARFDGLNDRIDGLRAASGDTGAFPGEAYDILTARLDDIADTIANLRQSPAVGVEHGAESLPADLNERLSVIDEHLRTFNHQIDAQNRELTAALEARFDSISRTVEEAQSRTDGGGTPSVGHLEQRLEQIVAMLTAGDGAGQSPTPAMFEQLEAQIAGIAEQLSPSQTAPTVDHESLIGAVRQAVDDAIGQMPAGPGASAEAVAGLMSDLRALEDLSRDAESRNSRTFEAIHDTLLQVVDHLSGLEAKITMPSTGVQAQAMAATGQVYAVPPSDEPVSPISTMGVHPATPASPAEAAADAARHALGQINAPAPAIDEPVQGERRSIFQSMANKLPIGRGRQAGKVGAEAAPDVYPDDPVDVVDDQPIEPGTDEVALADIMARVRQERTASSDKAAPTPAAPGAEHGKADFIAAARRAAQAAAADAKLMPTAGSVGTDETQGGWKAAFAKRRRPILLGAAAILLAILTIPVVRGFLAPAANNVAVTPPAVEQSVPQDSQQASAQDDPSISQEGPAVRDVTAGEPETPSVADSAQDGAAPLPGSEASPSLAANGGGPAAPSPDESQVQVVAADDIPDIVTSTALREAVIDGDPKALHVVGDLIANQPGDTDANMVAAFEWYERAANQGFAPSQYRLGNMYEKGLAAERDYAMAKTWYQLAAEQGNASAMHNLAVLFASGATGQPDYQSAARWFMEAAELGVRDSQYNLGILSAQGQGMPQDLVESYKWFALAALSGDEDAATKRDEVAAALSDEQRQTAQDTTALWRAKPVDEAVNVVELPDGWQIDTRQTATQAPLSDADMRQAIANIQAILNANGFDAGPVDGIMGGRTRDAIITFQQQNDLPPTGQVDQALVEKLLSLADENG